MILKKTACVIVAFLAFSSAFAVEVSGLPGVSKVLGQTMAMCQSEKDLTQYDHGLIGVQYDNVAISNGSVEMGLSLFRLLCEKDGKGLIGFVNEDPFASYSFEYPASNVVTVQPLRYGITVYDATTFEVLGTTVLLPGTMKNLFAFSIDLANLLSNKDVNTVQGGQKIERKLGIYVNQLSEYTNKGVVTQINNKYQLKTSLIFF